MRQKWMWPIIFCVAGIPLIAQAQYSEIKMGEYLHYATAAANGGVYAGIDGIGYVGVFGNPSLYTTNTGWVDLPVAQGFNTASQIYGTATAISHDGAVVAGSVTGTPTNGVTRQVAAYWVNGVESVVPDPPDDPGAITVSATAVSGDGTTLLVQDGTAYSATVETFVYNIASGTFTSLGFLGGAVHQTYATAINRDGTVVAGYSSLDNLNISGFIWNATNGVTVMGIPPDHPDTAYLEPTCMSDDGMTVYGKLTEFSGWDGFRYTAASGFEDIGLLGGFTPSACSADGSEVVGIEYMYFPAVWSVGNGGGYLDHLVTENVVSQAIGTTEGPVTISPDGSAITVLGPDAYLTDQTWYGTWQISLPVPLKTAPIPMGTQTFYTDYQTALTEPAGTLTQNTEFNTGVSAALVKGPHYASSFVLNADGSFSYTPKPGYISAGTDPEDGTPTDNFTYKLLSPNGTSTNAMVWISVSSPLPPTLASPTYANVTPTSATLGGAITDSGGETVTSVGVVYAPSSITSNPQIGDGVSSVAPAVVSGVFTVVVSNLMPNTAYSYAAYATNSAGIGYSTVDSFTSLATLQSWQQTWFGSPTNNAAALSADPYQTGVPNYAVYAFLGPYQDPSTASVSQLPHVQVGEGDIFYDFYEPSGVSGVTYGAQWCPTLQSANWQAVADTGDPAAVPPEHIFTMPMTNTQMFLRLTVTFH